jgi:hypothetical protein
MPALRILCALPDGIFLPPGDYGLGHSSLSIHDTQPADAKLASLTSPSSRFVPLQSPAVSMPVSAADGWDREQRNAFQLKSARQLLLRLNLMIRWYRAEMQATSIHELTLAHAGLFRFVHDPGGEPWGEFSANPPVILATAQGSAHDAVQRVREGFASEQEPPVEVLLLLDARLALSEGRFRETVLFWWSTIDAKFSSRFDSLVDDALAEEWGGARNFLTGIDFGLRHRMTIGMRLVGGESFFKQPGDFWTRLSASYERRNAIIHRGEVASEADAQHAIDVAEEVDALMNKMKIETHNPA